MKRGSVDQSKANIVVLIALAEEHDVFLEQFKPIADLSNGDLVRLVHDAEHADFTLTSVLAKDMGSDAACSSAYSAIADLRPDLVVCLGIAGSLSNDARLGDVCVANEIVDVLHNSKVLDPAPRPRRRPGSQSRVRQRRASAPRPTVQLSPRTYAVNTALQASSRFLRSHPLQRDVYDGLRREMAGRWESLVAKFGSDSSMELDAEQENDFHVGPIVCGPVSVSRDFNSKLKDINRKVLAIETESGGVFRVCQENGIPAITIRGISDKADKNKKRLEDKLASSLRTVAMENATSFLRAMLRNIAFLNEATRHRDGRINGTSSVVQETKPETILREAETRIQRHLEAASAEFKNRPVEAPLPLPRLRRAATNEDVVVSDDDRPVSIFDALSEERRIFIKVPRSFPEKNVAWYIALSLLKNEIDGKQVLPIVVDASAVTPPSAGIRNAAGEELFASLADINFAPVLLISEPDFESDSKMSFLAKELKSFGSVATVVVSKCENPVEAIDSFKLELGLSDYFTASMPLADIANYLERAFEMPPEEADVVATRLDETFSKFRLHTHPAYFIGLQESTLDALIDANQRAELIQLAVDGLLTFVVANDTSVPKLSRTTREEFLSELAFKIRVEKRTFSKSGLVKEAEEFARRKALEIDALEFVRGFLEFGLLNDVSDKVAFSLPFLEAFLLSEKLIKDRDSARQYFDPDQDEFDYYAFDLYSERGADNAVVDRIVAYAERAFASSDNEPNVLEGKSVQPRALKNSNTLLATAKEMGTASEKMTAEPSSNQIRQEKQRLIDAREAVANKVGTERRALRKELSEEVLAEFSRLDALSRSATLLATLVGSGAERLDGCQKFKIAPLLLHVSERFLHHWTKNRLRVDFDDMRSELLSEDSIKEIVQQMELFEDSTEEVRNSLSLFIDDQEVKMLSGPLATVLHRLAVYAGVRALRPVVTETKPNNTTEAILRASWLMEIDAAAGKAAVKSAFRGFGGPTLVRLTVASHFMWRIFWHHWQMASRLTFAETAKLTLRPLGLKTAEDHQQKMLGGHKSDG